MKKVLEIIFWNNTIFDWICSLGLIATLFIVIEIIRRIILKKAGKWALNTRTNWDNFLIDMVERSALPALYAGSVFYALKSLTLPPTLSEIIHTGFSICVTYFVLRTISAAFRKFVLDLIHKQENSIDKKKQAGGLILIASVAIWVVGIIFLMDNLGYSVTTLIAGLGIGGIAIALAAQAILGDLFSYFVIFFDKPFEVGDFIVVDDKSGVIEYIGIKTTRIRALSGEQMIFSNTDLTNARMHNYKRMQRRRIVFQLGIIYQSTREQLAAIPGIVKEIIDERSQLSFDRGHFSGFGDSSLNFEFVYYVLDPDYTTYMDNQEEVYLEIFAAFEARGIEFAYPTQTIFVQPPVPV